MLARQTLATLNNFAKYGERFRAHVAVLPLAAQALGEVNPWRPTDPRAQIIIVIRLVTASASGRTSRCCLSPPRPSAR